MLTICCLREDQGCSFDDDLEVILLSSWRDSLMWDATRGVRGVSQLLDFNTNQNQNNVIATAFKPPAVKRVDI